jgi:type II secretory ATPase GspE/PulE/Tfp pilus assembly ATPase PilB-like protein/CheY-like chemotaxis protein
MRPNTPVIEAWTSVARSVGMSPDELARQVAPVLQLGVADLDDGDRRARRLIPERVARRYNILPLRDDDRFIYIATADPTNLDAEQSIEFASGRRVVAQLAAPGTITRAINAAYSAGVVVDSVLAAIAATPGDIVRVIDDESAPPAPAAEIEAGPIVKLVNVVLRDAILQEATDVHIEPGANGGTIRFRVDGMMRVYLQLPTAIVARAVSRIKVLSRLNIADRLRPQDGRARIQVDDRVVDLRISTVPTRDAEKAVIRILRPLTNSTLDAARLPADAVARIRVLLGSRDGIVAITGPTGSGKTTTIYAAVREIAAREVNVVTVEDPVEYEIAGITQIQIDPKRNVTFASALRSILRQDPDVIFVGEIRDLETARIAVQAAMTGHLVLATVHANDAVGAVARLRDLGVDLASLAATLRGSIAQRLVRRLCANCSIPVGAALTDEEARLAAQYGIRPIRRATGCAACGHSGYRGRVPVAEVAIFGHAAADEIASGTTPGALTRTAIAGGMHTLMQAGLDRVAAGETTLQEIERVLGAMEQPAEAMPDAAVDAGHPADAAIEQPERGTGPAVLLVEDDPVERRLARAVLERGGFEVTEAVNGREALTLCSREARFALVLTDLVMDELDGEGLLRSIRATVNPELPVIVLTGSNDQETESRLLDAGADDYLRKPIDPVRLLARIKATLRRTGVAEPAGD